MSRPLRVLVVGSGASWSTADVEAGLVHGLEQAGVEVVRFRLADRIDYARKFLHLRWRQQKAALKRTQPMAAAPAKPTSADIIYQASTGVLERALRFDVDVVLIVSGMLLHPDAVAMLRRAGKLLTVLLTESPYDEEQEVRLASLVHGVWTNERVSVPALQRVCPNVRYLPHAWHPLRHGQGLQPGDELVPAHDVVFVGSAFRERIDWFQAIDWSGIDLGLYGNWTSLGPTSRLRQYVRGGPTDNARTAALYRRAKVGLNLYRTSKGWGMAKNRPRITYAESLSPRAYELAACGVFHLSEYRAEVAEVFGAAVPTFTTPTEAAALLRLWLADDAGRARIAASLPAMVAESSWVQRARQVVSDLQALVDLARAQAAPAPTEAPVAVAKG